MQARKRAMAAAGLCSGKLCRHGEAPPPGLIAHGGAGLEGIEADRLVFGPHAARGTKVRNPAFGRNAGSGEGYDDTRRLDHRAQPCNRGLQFHIVNSLSPASTAPPPASPTFKATPKPGAIM